MQPPANNALERLIVFARPPILGRAKTRLAAAVGPEAALALYRAFLSDTLALARRCSRGRTVEICFSGAWRPDPEFAASLAGLPSTLQGPGELGERLARAFARSHATGCRSTVVLGADAPTLPDATVEEAFAALAAGHDVALAPATDGGYVLLGARRPAPELFVGIPWGTPNVAARTLERAHAAGRTVARLAPWHDVDDDDGLARLFADLDTPAIAARAPASLRVRDARFPDRGRA